MTGLREPDIDGPQLNINKNRFHFKPSGMGRLFRHAELAVVVDAYRLSMDMISGSESLSIPLHQVDKVRAFTGLLWSSLVLSNRSQGTRKLYKVAGLRRGDLQRLHALLKLLPHWNPTSQKVLSDLIGRAHALLESSRLYTSRAGLERVLAGNDAVERQVITACRQALELHVTHVLDCDIAKMLDGLKPESHEPRRVHRNGAYIARIKGERRELFSAIERTPLSDEQQTAVLVDEASNLVVAAAGSGKTSTMIGKAAWLVQSGRFEPEEILALAFAKDAAQELTDRLSGMQGRILPSTLPIAASTFHRFGKEIIGQARGYSPSVCNDPDKVILSLIDKLCNSDTSFAKDWLTFITVFMPNFRLMTDFVSKAELDSYMSRQGIKRGEAPRALAGHRVASMEELSISNWMFLHGYYYEYERPYPYNLADKDHRQYLPDFYFPDADIYYEHFGVDNNGRPAPFLGQEYVELIHAKRKLHAQHKTRLIETCSGQFADGSIFTKLESMLVAAGINAIPLTSERLKAALQMLKRLANGPERLVVAFLHHVKANGIPIESLAKKLPSYSDRARIFLRVMTNVMAGYDAYLRANNLVDFDDMILHAAELIKSREILIPIRAVIVDEFQDISSSRVKLLKAILSQHSDSELVAVGDDWQSIYRFAGADINFMTSFSQFFGIPGVTHLTATYRCNKGIATTAATFVQRNPGQLRKEVRTIDQTTQGTIQILRHRGWKLDRTQLMTVLDHLAQERPGARIFLIERTRFNQADLGVEALNAHYRRRLNVSFHTFHSCKGLEADYVILLGMNEGYFPSIKEDDQLMSMVMPKWEEFPFAEERRLFYVGLTWAKHRVILVTQAGSESCFIKELERDSEPGVVVPYLNLMPA